MPTPRAQELETIYTEMLEWQEFGAEFLRDLEESPGSPETLPPFRTTVGEARVYVAAIHEVVTFIEHRRHIEHHREIQGGE